MSKTQKLAEKTSEKVPAPTPTSTPSLSQEEMRSWLARGMAMIDDPRRLIPQIYDQMKEHEGPVKDKDQGLIEKGLLALGFENDYSLIETIDEKYRPMAVELRRQLIKDFDCKTYSEKVLVDTVTSGYMRHLRSAKVYNNILAKGTLDKLGCDILSTMGKEMDRAQRQLMTALQTLVNLKRPPLKVQVKAQNAFVAQNQQLNVQPQPKPTPQP